MNKGDLAAAVADKTGMSKSSATQAVEAVFGCITDSLKKGQEVRVLGFGNFTVSKRVMPGRNPQTGRPCRSKLRSGKVQTRQGLKGTLNS
jgi:DNA-binding protein HU-beta